ncbi:MAG: hypothetical protein QMC79_08160 [Anaerosomatales bacterium]|nr:hypothetical protein [Anaerosomatales bacterium]
MYVTVAVATGAEGFTTMTGLIPAFVFHAVVSIAGLQALSAARRPVVS